MLAQCVGHRLVPCWGITDGPGSRFQTRARSGLRAAFQPRVALLDERLELGLLRGEAVGVARLIARARHGRRLLDQLPDVVARNGDAVVDLVERQDAKVGHWAVSADKLTDCLTAAGARQKPPTPCQILRLSCPRKRASSNH